MSERYYTYLASREWALKREAVRERSGNRCERCQNAPQQAVNHLSYEHLYHEPLEDLQAICNACHAFLSAKSDWDPIAFVAARYADRREDDRHLIISIRREAICETCGFETEGNHYICTTCKRLICAACSFTVSPGRAISEARCVDHAETA